jgi:hypothetical protein
MWYFCVMQVYKQYIKLTFSVIIPLLILLVLNLRIFLAMRKSRLRFDPLPLTNYFETLNFYS